MCKGWFNSKQSMKVLKIFEDEVGPVTSQSANKNHCKKQAARAS